MDQKDKDSIAESQGDAPQICPDCKKVIHEESASLTQWIFTRDSCVCNRAEFIGESQAYLYETLSSVAQICGKCGKRIIEEEEGSLTQWIFKSHRCSCSTPVPIAPHINHVDHEEIEISDQLPEKIEIRIDSICTPEELDTWLDNLTRFSPIKCLGKGAMGSVFMCFDNALQRTVAVKCLNHSSDKTIVSFQNEARAISNINHEGIVKIIDFGIVDGDLPYMVMDYIDGVSLCDHISQNLEIPVDTTIELARKISRSLKHAHEQNVLHRDVKSTNILISQDENGELYPVLIDFGVAKLKHEADEEQYETLVGSASYMAPDYIESKNYTQQSEIYSLGIVLYECLTGAVPFLGENYFETVSMHLNNEIPSLSETRPDLEFSAPVEDFIERCLSRDLNKRFKSMQEIIEVLDDLVAEPGSDQEIEQMEDSSEQGIVSDGPGKDTGFALNYGALALLVLIITGVVIFISSSSLFTSKKSKGNTSLESFDLNIDVTNKKEKYSKKDNFEVPKGKSYNYYYKTAESYQKKRIPDKALKYINQAIKMRPEKADAYSLRALIYYQLMHFSGSHTKMSMAVSDLKKALSLDPKNKIAYRYLAVWNIEEGNPKKAIEILNEAIKVCPDEPRFLRYRAIANQSLNNYSAAIKDASGLVSLNPEYHANYKLRGQLYESAGDYKKAFEDYSSAIRYKNTNFAIYFLRANSALKVKKYDIAIKDFDTILKRNPSDGYALRLRAEAYFKKKEYKKALADIDSAIENNPNLAELYQTRSAIYEKLGDPKKAISDRKKALELKNRPAEKKVY